MKINDKHVATFASSDSPIDKEGYLQKRGEVNKAYQRRYFILKGNLLYYFEKRFEKEPIGVIILEECTVEVAEGNPDGNSFELVFPGVGSRHYLLSADSQETMESWMRAITCANYEYTKLLVSELQRQLDELNLEQATSQSHQTRQAGNTKNPIATQPSPSVLRNSNVSLKARQNPFNMSSETDSAADPVMNDSHKVRTFEEMHSEYGKYVQEKMAEYEKEAEK